jgi:hypothetical protein
MKKTPTKKQTKQEAQKIEREKKQVRKLVYTACFMIIGLVLFKFLPMQIYGKDILFDASVHITTACFILYVIYFFIDQDKNWRIPYFIFCFMVLTIISLQRIISYNHDDVGLLLGLVISMIAIMIPRWGEIRKEVEF